MSKPDFAAFVQQNISRCTWEYPYDTGDTSGNVSVVISPRFFHLMGDEPNGVFTGNSPGWQFYGEVHSDYYTWCPTFVAFDNANHKVVVLRSDVLYASDQECLDRFLRTHGKYITTFDIRDI